MFAISSGCELPSGVMTLRNSFHETPSGKSVNSFLQRRLDTARRDAVHADVALQVLVGERSG